MCMRLKEKIRKERFINLTVWYMSSKFAAMSLDEFKITKKY